MRGRPRPAGLSAADLCVAFDASYRTVEYHSRRIAGRPGSGTSRTYTRDQAVRVGLSIALAPWVPTSEFLVAVRLDLPVIVEYGRYTQVTVDVGAIARAVDRVADGSGARIVRDVASAAR